MPAAYPRGIRLTCCGLSAPDTSSAAGRLGWWHLVCRPADQNGYNARVHSVAKGPSSRPSGFVPQWAAPAGCIRGWQDGPVVRATGIRYARAERYRPPVSEPPANDPIDATHWSPGCPQPVAPVLEKILHLPLGDLAYDEDCLRLSVTLPADTAAGDRLPVLVWIHGGAYVWGAGDAPVFDPATIAVEQGLVVVSVTYRLGLFGYLGTAHGTANLGLLDQIEALRWVQRNIAAFGGNPANVTVFGQSAGADAIAHLMIARGVEKLFQRAIMASAPLGILHNRERMYAHMAAVAERLPARASTAEVVDHQRLVQAGAKAYGLKSAMAFGVHYGRDPLPPESELAAAYAEAANTIDLMIGWTTREAALFTVTALGRLTQTPVLGPIAHRAAITLVTDRVYARPGRAFARHFGAAGGRGYRYLMRWGAPGNPYRGAHLIECSLLFPGRGGVWGQLIDGVDPETYDRDGRRLRELEV